MVPSSEDPYHRGREEKSIPSRSTLHGDWPCVLCSLFQLPRLPSAFFKKCVMFGDGNTADPWVSPGQVYLGEAGAAAEGAFGYME